MSSVIAPQLRDPAWFSRIRFGVLGITLLIPALVATEFKPWLIFEEQNLKITLKFLGDFFPPSLDPSFLKMIALEAWKTIAIATVGIFLALILAIPMTLMSTRVLSISSLSGKMNLLPFALRQTIRLI